MPGPRPLHPSVRQRQNKTTTAAALEVLAPAVRSLIEVPELPSDRVWDPKTSDWWVDVWQSPMRVEWDPADTHALLQTAYLIDEFYRLVTADKVDHYKLVKVSDQVMKRCARMGVDPFARRSLQWLLVQTERDEADRDLKKERAAASRDERTTKRRPKGYGALQ